ncbi:MATE family efflux transporter [[Clostridium] innocuum]|nr:MATE family efflux transporter [Erysipelotrichaceae bacterium]MCR0384219.1 MATE family efflux transporter [[Clostridium] innocuum]MCR0411625.1 MATE family efflux transporter [[Clostridium] innocuum]MCR0533202.1 MATE family efflux transporter [[Clostridium] innocuum]MCR0540393.1 MATE family efflux transporter [[Clostridium] innocuum]
MFTNANLKRLILPLVVEQILAVTIGMSDTIMVSSVGEAAVSGLSLVDTINILLINIFAALATGGAVVCSQYLGGQDRARACVSAKQLVLSTGILAVIIMAVVLIGCTTILQLVFTDVEPAVMWNAEVYFKISAWSYPFIALYNSGAALFRSMGNSKISMVTSLFMNAFNIVGNAVLIYGFHMGVAGAALSSLVSRILGFLFMLYLLRSPDNLIYIDTYRKLEFHPAMIRRILTIGIPNGLENGMFQIGKILVQGLIAGFGTVAIAANAVANNIAQMEIIPAAAIGLAMITVVGQCVGARDYEQARLYIKKLMKISYISMIALNLIILCLVPFILNIYNLSAQTYDTAMELLLYHGIFAMVLWPASFTFPNALRAAGDVRFTMCISIVSMWLCRICLSWLLGAVLGLGVLGVWLAMFTDWLFRILWFYWRYRSGSWMQKRIIT